jgi:hypothetical protein
VWGINYKMYIANSPLTSSLSFKNKKENQCWRQRQKKFKKKKSVLKTKTKENE